jgi:hypothetical protein
MADTTPLIPNDSVSSALAFFTNLGFTVSVRLHGYDHYIVEMAKGKVSTKQIVSGNELSDLYVIKILLQLYHRFEVAHGKEAVHA